MIQIIEKHEVPVPEYRVVCSRCGSGWTFNDEDIKGYGDQRDYYYAISCPVCGARYSSDTKANILKHSDITKLR